MSKLKNINRREFLSGVAVTGAAFGLSPLAAAAEGLSLPARLWTYPPEKTGMRGSHEGSFEVAHAVAWNGEKYDRPRDATDRPYDLVVVGGGISGLATAFLARQTLGTKARILILDNHDDFGGHAKRNEFDVRGKKLIGYGGSQSIDGPANYSAEAAAFIRAVGVETERFYRYFDTSFYKRHQMGYGLFLDEQTYGQNQLITDKATVTAGGLWRWTNEAEKAGVAAMIEALPFEDAEKRAFARLILDRPDWLAGKTTAEKIDTLRRTSFETCLKDHAGLGPLALQVLRREIASFWGVGWDALSGLEGVRMGHPAALGLGLDPDTVPKPYKGEEPYIFHFPDGNAGVARLTVAALIPDAVEASDMTGVVRARVHYDRLDLPENSVRIRLMSTAVDVRNTGDGVDVTYVRGGKAERVVARDVVMACYNHILPFILPEMPETQKEALRWPAKVPLAYINVALNSWEPFADAGVARIYTPSGICLKSELDFPVSMGGYLFADKPEDPILLHMVQVPTRPGLAPRDQHRKGRMDMLALTFDDYEQSIIGQLSGALGPHGFDAEKHIAAITVNRWPHGYAYEYNELHDPWDWSPKVGPHVAGRASIGRIAIANSDSSAYAYVNGAVDAAARAVKSLWG